MNIDKLVEVSHKTALEHGFYANKDVQDAEFIATQLCHMHGEISEALEALRDRALDIHIENGKPEGLVVELGDCIIRIADLCGALGLNLAKAIDLKVEYNKGRPYKHGRVEF